MKKHISIFNTVVVITLVIAGVGYVKRGLIDTFLAETVGPFFSQRVAPVVDSGKVLSTLGLIPNDSRIQDVQALTAANVIEATNRERIAAGLLPLKVSALLTESATYKNDDMIARQYFEHESPDGRSVSDLGKQFGYDYIIMGENLALGGFTDSADLVAAWMKSPGHRANILNTKYQDIGVAVKRATYQGRTVWFATQHFGTDRSVCPSIDTSLRSSIAILSADLKKREASITQTKLILESPDRPKGDALTQLVNLFNQMVTDYNSALDVLKGETASYNAQVNAFNTCLTKYQAK